MKARLIAALGISLLGAPASFATPEPTLNACEKPTRKQSKWKRVPENAPVTFLLPPKYAPDPKHNFQHGGWQWKLGETKIYEAFGHWGPESFGGSNKSTDTYSACEATIDGHEVLIVTTLWNGHYGALAWFKDLATPPINQSPIVGGEGKSREDQRLFLSAIHTAKVRK